MDMRRSTGYQHGLGSWHPAMRPNVHEPDLVTDEVFEQGPSGSEISTRNNVGHRELHVPNEGQPRLPSSSWEGAGEHSQAHPIGGIAESVNGSFVSPLLTQKPTASDTTNKLTVDDRTNKEQGHALEVRANGLVTASPREDMEQDMDSLETRATVREEDTHEAPTKPSVAMNDIEYMLRDKDEMGTAWELQVNSAARISLDRTNSIPEVPPLLQNEPIPPHSLLLSHAEDIKEEEKRNQSMEHSSTNIIASGLVAAGSSLDPVQLVGEEKDVAFFDIVQGIQAVADEQSKFGQGVPPMLSNSQDKNSTLAYNGTHEAETPATLALGDEDDVFNENSHSQAEATSTTSPPPLDRKPTAQVIDSLRHPTYSANHAEPDSEEERPSLAKATGGSIAIYTSTVESPVLAEQQTDLAEVEPKDEDLAEMWKAALGDDDLLVDDDDPVDPSSFFQDDGEGFLDGNCDESERYSSELASPHPLLEPIHGTDGNMRGFGEVNAKHLLSQTRYMPPPVSQSQQTYSYPPLPGQKSGALTPEHIQSAFEINQNAYPSTGITDQMGQRPSTTIATTSKPRVSGPIQSFADKSKGGYTSPYDLPMDVRPKKRTIHQQGRPSSGAQSTSNHPPPPRSSSMFAGSPPLMESHLPIALLPGVGANAPSSSFIPSPQKALPGVGSFFEDLPSTKPRPPSVSGPNVPPRPRPTQPPASLISSQHGPSKTLSLTQQAAPRSTLDSRQYPLLPPERMSLYGSAHRAEPNTQLGSTMNAKYSPAPTKSSSVPPPLNRYAASPSAGTRPLPSQALPFQPRTSSPLAHNRALSPQCYNDTVTEPPLRRPHSSSRHEASHQESAVLKHPLPPHQNSDEVHSNVYEAENESSWRLPLTPQLRDSPPPLIVSLQGRLSNTPSDSSYAINTPEPGPLSSDDSPQRTFELQMNERGVSMPIGPRRSQTQSPGAGMYRPGLPENMQDPCQRPASVNDKLSSTSAETVPPSTNHPRPRGWIPSNQLNYVRPTDGREMDHLERWKGCPIISFGFGGAIVTTFPKQIPRYASGQTSPMIKCSPGEVKLQDGKILSIKEDIASFPGPLKSRSKKKDVTDWLQRRILDLENEDTRSSSSDVRPDARKRRQEKMLLWKIVRVLVEHDGLMDGNVSAEQAVRSILSPHLSQGDEVAVPVQSPNAQMLGHSSLGIRNSPDREQVRAIEDLRTILLHGEREKAVWHAIDNRLWAHAMLLSSTLDKAVWKQVSQEFVRQEVRTLGENTESLAALYQIFSGNWEESVDELIPPSARAGLQMVSKIASNGPTKNALDGLDRWRETLTMILSNRSSDDGKALSILGRLLADYGRTEAAHICYIFVQMPGLFGGPDDPHSSFALLGADHLQHPFDYCRDLECILLTEVYDYARTILMSSSAATLSPHLQSYKLYHAMILAEHGFRTEAQQYCEVITSALKSTTKLSPYYHNVLFGALDNLVDRLRQAPTDNSGSWISKPSIDKVSGSIWAKFNQYVAGDESGAVSTGPPKVIDQDAGPFARISGNSPSLSRTPSSNELYSTYPRGTEISSSAQAINLTNSRYAPTGLYTPRSSLENTRSSSQAYSGPTQTDLLRPALGHQQYHSRPTSSSSSYHEPYKPVSELSTDPSRIESYLPTLPLPPEYMPMKRPDQLTSSAYQQTLYQPTPPPELQQNQVGYQPVPETEAMNNYELPSASVDPPSYTQEPLSTGGHEPPPNDYRPPSDNAEGPRVVRSLVEEKPQKKSFIDDDKDDDIAAPSAAFREGKARNSREADDAFKKAAEADAQKDTASKLTSKKSSWLGGWLRGRSEGDDAQSTASAPIRAKLGEESSFYYDSEKKRWIDKKNPDSTPTAATPPPPPKGPPSRAVSAGGAPRPALSATPPVPLLPTALPTALASSSNPPTLNGSTSKPKSQKASRSPSPTVPPTAIEHLTPLGPQQSIRSASGPPSGPPSAPPSRPATGMSGESSIEDLIGAPQARKGGTVKGKKKGRGYVDVMAK